MFKGEIWIQKQNGKCAKFFSTDWGGFSSVAQTVKAQITKSYMLHMLRNVRWCLATTYRKTKSTKTAYTKIKLPDCKDHNYVVRVLSKESSCQRCIASGNIQATNSCSTSHQEILDEVYVDISGVASKINQEYGNNIAEEKLAGIISSHWLLSGAKLVGSLVSPLQIDPTHDDNDVAGCLLLLHENSTLISGIKEAVVASNVSAIQDYKLVHSWMKTFAIPWKKWFKNFIPRLE